MALTKSMVRLEAHQKVVELDGPERLSAQTLDASKQQMEIAGFLFDSDPEEAWLRGVDDSGSFVLMHRRLPLALTSSRAAALALAAKLHVLEVSDYEALELNLSPESLDVLDWHAGIYPEDPDGIDLARMSAHDLFYATV